MKKIRPRNWWKPALCGVSMLLGAGLANATPLFIASKGGVVVTLHDTPCKLAAVANLPMRATWVEGGKTFEGCWAVSGMAPIVMMYFDDKSFAIAPMQEFERASNT